MDLPTKLRFSPHNSHSHNLERKLHRKVARIKQKPVRLTAEQCLQCSDLILTLCYLYSIFVSSGKITLQLQVVKYLIIEKLCDSDAIVQRKSLILLLPKVFWLKQHLHHSQVCFLQQDNLYKLMFLILLFTF